MMVEVPEDASPKVRLVGLAEMVKPATENSIDVVWDREPDAPVIETM